MARAYIKDRHIFLTLFFYDYYRWRLLHHFNPCVISNIVMINPNNMNK